MKPRQKYLMLILLLAVAVESFIIWRGSRSNNKLTADVEARGLVNDSLIRSGRIRDSADAVRYAAVRLHDSLQTRKLDSALHLLSVTKDSLKSKVAVLKQTVIDLGNAVAAFNDSSLQHAYDSTVAELDRVYMYGGLFVTGSDSTIGMLRDQMAYKDSLIIVLNGEISDLKKALTACTANFDGLKKDTDKLIKKAKARGLLSKIKTAAIVILGAFSILKK